jgi:hypothetical protein
MRAMVHRMSLCGLALLLSAGMASAADVRLLAVGGVKGALDKIIADLPT